MPPRAAFVIKSFSDEVSATGLPAGLAYGLAAAAGDGLAPKAGLGPVSVTVVVRSVSLSQAREIKAVKPSVKMSAITPLLFAMEFPPSAHRIEVNPDYERARLLRLAWFIELKTREKWESR